jgi:hypothetical protein
MSRGNDQFSEVPGNAGDVCFFLYGTSIKARGFAWFVDAKASSAYPRNKEGGLSL